MKLHNAIFCDDIRFELNNKFSLMGVYNDKIIFHAKNKNDIKFPVPIKLSLMLSFQLENNKSYPDNFEFTYFINKKHILDIKGNIAPNHDDSILLALTNQILPLEIGNLNFSINLLKDNKSIFSLELAPGLRILLQ